MREKRKNIVISFKLMSVGDESVDILFIMRDNGKSLPDELVGNSDHSEFTGLSVLPEPRVRFFTLSIKPACWPCGHIEESSGVCVSVAVDMPSDVYGSSGLFVSRTDTEIPEHLFGILEVSKTAGSDDECRGESYAYALNGGQKCELSAELGLDKAGKFD